MFWKDSMDFAKIIQNKEQVELKQEKKETIAGSKPKGIFLRN